MIQLRELQVHLKCLIDLVNSFGHQKTLFLKSIIRFQKQNKKKKIPNCCSLLFSTWSLLKILLEKKKKKSKSSKLHYL